MSIVLHQKDSMVLLRVLLVLPEMEEVVEMEDQEVVTVQLQIHCQTLSVPELYQTAGPPVNPTPIALTLVFAVLMAAQILVSMAHNVIQYFHISKIKNFFIYTVLYSN